MAKSLSQQKKEILGHMDFIANTLHKDGASVLVLDAYKTSLKSIKKADAFQSWYSGYTKRVAELLKHYPENTALINDQRHSIQRIAGLQR